MALSLYILLLYKHWRAILRHDLRSVETCRNSSALIVNSLYFNIVNVFIFSWILAVSAKIWTTWISLHRVGIKTAKFKSRGFCVHLSLIKNDFYWDFTKWMRKAAVNVISFHLSVRLSVAWTSATHTGKIFVKFLFHWNVSTHSDFSQNRTQITGTLHMVPCICVISRRGWSS